MINLTNKQQKNRNGLIELYRFLFALNVVKNHGFMPEGSLGLSKYFSPGRVSVEFFFILTGYLFVRTLEKLKDLPLKEGLIKLITGKLKPLFIPLVIGLASNIAYNIVIGEYFAGVWSYLWYVEAMMVTMIVYLILRKLIKSDKIFFRAVIGLCALATVMRFSGIFYEWAYVRSTAAISLGMLLSKIPDLKLKRKWPLIVALLPVAASCFLIVALSLGNVDWFGGFRGIELILDTVLYPVLIYLSFNLNFTSRICSYLGALSFGLYAFQCPAKLIRLLGVNNRVVLLSVIVGLTLIEDMAKRLYRSKKSSRLITHIDS